MAFLIEVDESASLCMIGSTTGESFSQPKVYDLCGWHPVVGMIHRGGAAVDGGNPATPQ